MNRRLKRTQERNQLLLTQEKCMNESITVEKQDENNVIDESKSKNCAELKIPEFTPGKSQLEQKSEDETRKIAAVRI